MDKKQKRDRAIHVRIDGLTLEEQAELSDAIVREKEE